ncbi:type II toxin-antitoxin system Phd/YefM family antitoxin [Erwinia pyrifoliae]|uniref:Antitoxin n=1 Tax=Erwinia pyrifoliae TaxID=79967 RepID=A0ABY5XF58_ERWPY|nr:MULTISPECIES: type II toxin-antitoxin system Phd/YefM family antitoxin [Erwinia]MCT2385494.1 type II toxin-antitoxin system Phd/YefM family antitoxin [Erwinia pyrifoliae]MCU8588933.1 type II toxin-antitoxin system Phd/YefM family antitoxin [Erwinia pyrifoliae]UWS31834.1 type II toxin-antitoxin system Phd/YefM family antitoxin [Erwinia pyrifoliae]UWS35479.1 type II toxin-antitoxin system Phd/YefM family antitoxin [Erwinia pyrifoliae]
MKEINVSDARQNLAAVLRQATDREPLTITRCEYFSAVMTSISEFHAWQTAKMDDEIAAIMNMHGDQTWNLTDK